MNIHDNMTIAVPLKGVESEHCALIVDKGISKLEGIGENRVELNNQRLLFKADKPERLNQVIDEIRQLGYDVQSVKKTFSVLNMTCASCAVSAESMVRSVRGVISASVNFASGKLNVEYLPNLCSAEDFKSALQSIGYDLLIEEGESQEEAFESIRKARHSTLKSKAIWAIALSLPVFVIGMFFMDMPYANQIMWVFSTPVVLWIGRDFFRNAWKQARHRSANMDTLVALSTGIAYLYSVFNMLFMDFWHNRGIHPHVYFEAASIVIAFILLGKLLEENSKDNTSSAIKKLMGLQVKTLTVIDKDGREKQMKIEQVRVGDIILVRPGDKIAVDGKVLKGQSYVDESMLSGEPIAVLKVENDKVFAGSINQKGSFRFEALKVGDETMLAQIIRMIQEAQGSKAPVQKLVDKIAGIFVPVVILISIVTFVVWLIFGGENSLSQALMASVTVLVIACPCALGLATPTAVMVGIGKAAVHGILIKDAESIEKASKVDAIVLDKTGTITEGKPAVTTLRWFKHKKEHADILFTLEKHSEHPLAEAIVEYLKASASIEISDVENVSGMGIRARFKGTWFYAGNLAMMNQYKIKIGQDIWQESESWARRAATVVYFSDEREVLGLLSIEDKIKSGSVEAIRQMKAMGIEVYMLTGDNVHTAKAMAELAGIDHYKSEVLPQDKSEFVAQLQAKGKVVAMVGDGINDSAALAKADVSIAMGRGSDIAMDVAKMTIVSSDLVKIPQAIVLSKHTVATIKQNLFWAFIYNVIGIPIAAGVLYPFNGFLLNPMIAGAAMALSSVSVVSNSLRLNFKSLVSKNYKN